MNISPAASPSWSSLGGVSPCASLLDLLASRAALTPNEVAFRFLDSGSDDQILTFEELDTEARFIASELLRYRDQRPSVAMLLYGAGLEFVAAFFGCLYAGVLPTAVSLSLTPGGIAKIASVLTSSGAGFVLANSAHLYRFRRALAEQIDVSRQTWLASDEFDPDEAAAIQLTPAARGDGLAFLQYSSGSTGAEKGIAVSHSNVIHNLELLRRSFEPTARDVCVSWLPHYHDMGLIAGVLHSIYAGVPCVLMSPSRFLRRPYDWLEAISRFGGTFSGGPNFAYEYCISKITPADRAKLDLSTWEVAISGAEPVRAQTLQRFSAEYAAVGFNPSAFYPTYGLAEATLMVSGGFRGQGATLLRARRGDLEVGRVRALDVREDDGDDLVACGPPRVPVRIVGADLVDAQPGEIGEILVRGDSITQGYWRGPDLPLTAFGQADDEAGAEGWLRTGDLGFLAAEQLYVTGRRKELIVIRGRNLYPQDIEATILQAGLTSNACTFSIDAEGEERLVVLLEAPSGALGDHEIERLLESVRDLVWRRHEVSVWRALAVAAGVITKTTSGKLQRAPLREQFRAGRLQFLKGAESA